MAVSGPSQKYVALMRGVNVGGKNRLPMKDLCEMFSDLGCRDVRSFIQSGNVIFRADQRLLKTLPASVTEGVARGFGFQSPVILRSHNDLKSVARSNPYLGRHSEETALYVMFLAEQPGDENVKRLDPQRSPPDEFQVRDREIFLYLLNGAAKSKLTNSYFDSRLKTVSTARNWRTVLTLLELTSQE